MNILFICRHEEIADTVLRLLNEYNGWKAWRALRDEEALALFNEHPFDLVLIGGGVDRSSEEMLTRTFLSKNPHVKIVQHFGGGSGLLFNEIHEALRKP